jgi:DNA-binding transcriptional LysR family regulator
VSGEAFSVKWDDIKIFLAVADSGSSLAASRKLGVNQTTVSRRVDAFEKDTGLVLFHRELSGYRLTQTGTELREAAQPVQMALAEFQSKLTMLSDHQAGRIKITGPAEAINHWVYPILNRFRGANPNIVMEVDTSEQQLDLGTGEVDLAVRLTDEIEDERLIARRISAVPWGVYCRRAYEQTFGAPRNVDEAGGHAVVHYTDRMAKRIHPIRWLGHKITPEQIKLRVSSVPGMVTALKSEDAIGVLPKVVGDNTPELVPCFWHDELRHNCWVVASADAYTRPIVRKCMKQIADEFPKKDL